jgi:hypothetical protein
MELTKLENTVVGPVFLTNSQMKLPAASGRGIQKIRIKRHNQEIGRWDLHGEVGLLF